MPISTRSVCLVCPPLRALNSSEPPWYGPVCPVVWEGGAVRPPPIPILSGASGRRVAADHRDDALALLSREQTGRAGALFVVERTFEAALLIAPGKIANRLPRQRQHGGNPRCAHALPEPLQRNRPQRHADLFDSSGENLLQRRLIALGNLHAQGGTRHALSMPKTVRSKHVCL